MNTVTSGIDEDDVVPGLDAAITRFGHPHLECQSRPIFVLASGWRSGSTLLQRMLTSDRTLIWGEPYHLGGAIQSIIDLWAPFSESWPDARHIVDPDKSEPIRPSDWLANLYPPVSDIIHGQRAFLERAFAEPAHRMGYDEWGIKEVRIGGGGASVLRYLFPNARIVFLVRNPYDAYLSYRTLLQRRSVEGWYFHWPEGRVTGAAEFGAIWHRLASSHAKYRFRAEALQVRYEDLTDPTTIKDLTTRVGVPLDAEQTAFEVGSSFTRSESTARPELSDREIAVLRSKVSVVAEDFGYFGPSGS